MVFVDHIYTTAQCATAPRIRYLHQPQASRPVPLACTRPCSNLSTPRPSGLPLFEMAAALFVFDIAILLDNGIQTAGTTISYRALCPRV